MKILPLVVALMFCPSVGAVDVQIRIDGEIVVPPCTGVADPIDFGEIDISTLTDGNYHWIPRNIVFDCPYGSGIPKVRFSGDVGYVGHSVKTSKHDEGLSALVEVYHKGAGTNVPHINGGYWDASNYVTRTGDRTALHTRFGLYHDTSKKLMPGPFSASVTVGMKYD